MFCNQVDDCVNLNFLALALALFCISHLVEPNSVFELTTITFQSSYPKTFRAIKYVNNDPPAHKITHISLSKMDLL